MDGRRAARSIVNPATRCCRSVNVSAVTSIGTPSRCRRTHRSRLEKLDAPFQPSTLAQHPRQHPFATVYVPPADPVRAIADGLACRPGGGFAQQPQRKTRRPGALPRRAARMAGSRALVERLCPENLAFPPMQTDHDWFDHLRSRVDGSGCQAARRWASVPRTTSTVTVASA